MNEDCPDLGEWGMGDGGASSFFDSLLADTVVLSIGFDTSLRGLGNALVGW